MSTSPLQSPPSLPTPSASGGPAPWAWAVSALRPGSLTRSVVVVALLAILLAWLTVAVVLYSKRQDALRSEQQHSANLARILQEQTERVLATADQASLRLADAVATGAFSAGDIVRLANETGLAPKILLQLALIGPDGRLQSSNLDPDGSKSGHVDLSDREHVRAHLNPKLAPDAPPLSPSGLLIGKPVLGKVSKKWTIQLSRRITSADGQVLGVVVASLDAAYFEGLYRGVELGGKGGVTLLGSDGMIRARVIGGQSSGVGTTFKAGAGGFPFTGERGAYESVSRVDGVQRLVSYRQVAGYPLYVAVLRAHDEALASWHGTLELALMLTGGLTLAVLGAALIFGHGVRRLEDSNAALRISEAQANASNQAKTEFLAAVSHELRTPLTSIRGFAHLMEMRIPEPRFKEQAGLIRKAAEYLNDLLTGILDLVKVEAGEMALAPRSVVLRPLMEGSVAFFAVTAAEKGLQLQLAIAPGAPEALLVDELRLKQVINNLLSNALKFTKEGRVDLLARREGAQLLLQVRDTGPGIPAHLHETVFERFRQGDAQVSYQHGGTGLGLALSRGLAQLMGGTLTLQSEPGQGATFTLAVPLQGAVYAQDDGQAGPAGAQAPTAAPGGVAAPAAARAVEAVDA